MGRTCHPTFSDVRGTNAAWAEGYIESCVAQGIISGVGGGRFSPNGNVTGSQLAKMLLVCLGFDSDIEGYTGNAWDMNVNVNPITLLKDKYNAEVKDGGIVTSVKEDSKGTYTVKTDKNANGYTKVAKDYSDLMGQKVDVLVKISDNTVYGVYANEDSKGAGNGCR